MEEDISDVWERRSLNRKWTYSKEVKARAKAMAEKRANQEKRENWYSWSRMCGGEGQEKTMEAINLKFISLGRVIIHCKHISAGSYVSEVLLGYRKTLYAKAHPILKL